MVCTAPYRQDDLLLVQPVSCALNATALTVLCYLWMAAWIALLAEGVLARYWRRVDRSPPYVAAVYLVWCAVQAVLCGYVAGAAPSSLVLREAVPLWLFLGLAVLLNSTLLVAGMLHIAGTNVSSSSVSAERRQLERLISISTRLAALTLVALWAAELVLLVVLPQTAYFDDPAARRATIVGGYIAYFAFIVVEVVGMTVLLARLIAIVAKRLRFNEETARRASITLSSDALKPTVVAVGAQQAVPADRPKAALRLVLARLKAAMFLSLNLGVTAIVLWGVIAFYLQGIPWWMFILLSGPVPLMIALGKLMIFRPKILKTLARMGVPFVALFDLASVPVGASNSSTDGQSSAAGANGRASEDAAQVLNHGLSSFNESVPSPATAIAAVPSPPAAPSSPLAEAV